ncbi:MAG: hypothetical protein HY298_08705 [Verrucomicrobia bacterium]|nr:hypothetical protein [Verrucomicrobiota bacterium]
MKTTTLIANMRVRWLWPPLLVAWVVVSRLTAAETNAPAKAAPPLTPQEIFEGGKETYNNWIELSAGGFFTSGDKAQFQQRHRAWGGPFGGIEDFHYQATVATNTTLSVDGRALFDNDDYKLKLDLTREKLGYLRFSYNEFRTWYNGDGGFDPPSNMWYPLSGNALALDRGEISFAGGLTLEKVPTVTFKYTHTFRDGDKSSTIWGTTHPGGGPARGLSPSFYDINEHSDIFQLDVAHRILKTDFGVGLRYESGKLDDALKIDQSPGEPIDRKITDRTGTSYDLFNAHAFTETWIKKNLFFSSGFSFSDLDNDFSGSRIYGSDFDVSYAPNAANGAGYFGLNGGARMQEYVMNLNLLAIPLPNFSSALSLRVQKEDVDADVRGFETLGDNPATPFSGNSERDLIDVRERLDLRYTGVTNWVFYGRGEWTQGDGNLKENGGFGPVNGVGVAPIQRETEDSRFFQKYSLGATWYAARQITLDAGGYYKINHYDYDHLVDDTPNNSPNRYPAYLVMQNFETYDGNLRLTLRPWQNVTMISRYEFQSSTIHTKPDSTSGLGEVESSEMTSHIFAQNISWSPWSRLYLQAGLNYVLSETRTPVSKFTQAILNAQNNYWTLNFSSGLVLDDKTTLNASYFYYRADNYHDNSSVGVPYGAGAEEHGITATLMRQLTKNLRLNLRYGYFRYKDEPSNGNMNYDAHLVFSSLQYRF